SLADSVDSFDPALGTLQSATLAYSFTFNVSNIVGEGSGWVMLGGGGAFMWNESTLSGSGISGGDSTPVPFEEIEFDASISNSLTVTASEALAILFGTEPATFGWHPTIVLQGNQTDIAGDIVLSSGTLSMTFNYAP